MGIIKNGLLHTTLRELRLWHFREAVKCRALADGFEALASNSGLHLRFHTAQAHNYRDQAALHSSAVEVLDDVVDGRVEDDYRSAST